MVLITLLVSYLIGSIPFGLIFSKIYKLADIRNIGSGNIGATNVLRTGNKKAAILTLLCDLLKGTLAIYLFRHSYTKEIVLLHGLAAIIGHIYPVFLRFKGGKGVASFAGVILGFNPILFLIFVASWLFVAFISRYSSLAALTASWTVCLFSIFTNATVFFIFMLIALLISFTHRDNIKRLVKRTEHKIQFKK